MEDICTILRKWLEKELQITVSAQSNFQIPRFKISIYDGQAQGQYYCFDHMIHCVDFKNCSCYYLKKKEADMKIQYDFDHPHIAKEKYQKRPLKISSSSSRQSTSSSSSSFSSSSAYSSSSSPSTSTSAHSSYPSHQSYQSNQSNQSNQSHQSYPSYPSYHNSQFIPQSKKSIFLKK